MDMSGAAPAAGAGAPAAGSNSPAAPADGSQNPGNVNPGASNSPEGKPGEGAVPQKFKFKFQVDGKDVEEEYDEATLRSTLQKAKGADKRFQEAAETKQQVARMLEMLKSPQGLKKLLQHPNLYGAKARQVMEELLWEDVQREQMDPKERERLDMSEKLRKYEEDEKTRSEQARKEAVRVAEEAVRAADRQGHHDAIKEAGQQVTPYFFKRVAHYMLSAMQQGKQVTPKDVMCRS
jgi:hypothetical protein